MKERNVDELNLYLEQVFPDCSVRQTVLSKLAKCQSYVPGQPLRNYKTGELYYEQLRASNDRSVLNFVGSGNNSKSCFIELIKSAFPGKVVSVPPQFFTKEFTTLLEEDIVSNADIILCEDIECIDRLNTSKINNWARLRLIIFVSNEELKGLENVDIVSIPFISKWIPKPWFWTNMYNYLWNTDNLYIQDVNFADKVKTWGFDFRAML